MDDPLVRVAHPEVPDYADPSVRMEMPDLLYVTCTTCGVVADYRDASPGERHRLQELAKRHANEQHDGLVAAEGWAR